MAGPDRPPVIPQAEGLRKIRFAPARAGRGKSGACRVGYVQDDWSYSTIALLLQGVAVGWSPHPGEDQMAALSEMERAAFADAR